MSTDDTMMDDEGGHLKRNHLVFPDEDDDATRTTNLAARDPADPFLHDPATNQAPQETAGDNVEGGPTNKWVCVASSNEESLEGDAKSQLEDAPKHILVASDSETEDDVVSPAFYFSDTGVALPSHLAAAGVNVMTVNDTLMDDEGGHLKRNHTKSFDEEDVDSAAPAQEEVDRNSVEEGHMNKWVCIEELSDEESIDI